MDETLTNEVREALTALSAFMSGQETRLSHVETLAQKALQRIATPGLVLSSGAAPDTLGGLVSQAPAIKEFMAAGGRFRGSAPVPIPGRLVTKSTIVTGTTLKPGVQVDPVAPLPQAPLAVADLIPQRALKEGVLQFVRQTGSNPVAGIQAAQGDPKLESTVTFETITQTPETLATWIAASKQSVTDIAGLTALIDNVLRYALQWLEDGEILNGVPPAHLTGILPVASVVAPVAGDSALDAISRVFAALTSRGVRPSGVVMHPTDFLNISLATDTTGSYLLGSPTAAPTQMLWGVPVVQTTQIPLATVLAGDFLRGSELAYREDASVEISTEHADFFVRNLVCIKAEERLTLAIRQASYFAKCSALPAPTVMAAATAPKKA
jgi:HK97 family phage major capsid protein